MLEWLTSHVMVIYGGLLMVFMGLMPNGAERPKGTAYGPSNARSADARGSIRPNVPGPENASEDS